MPTKEEDFKARFSTILADVRDLSPPEDLLLLGSLAAQIISAGTARTWSQFKATLSANSYSALLTTFQTQGNALAKQGALRQMHAIEVLACSLIARTQVHDADVLSDDKILDRLIDKAIAGFRERPPASTEIH